MKTKLFALAFFALIQLSWAQQDSTKIRKNFLGCSPLGIFNKIRLSYEQHLTPNMSIGITGTYYNGLQAKGQRIDVSGRYYFKTLESNKGLGGWYAIGGIGVSRLHKVYDYKYSYQLQTFNNGYASSSNGASEGNSGILPGKFLNVYNSFAGIGYKVPLKQFYFDMNVKFQYSIFNIDPNETVLLKSDTESGIYKINNSYYDSGFKTIGPASYFAPSLIFGYMF